MWGGHRKRDSGNWWVAGGISEMSQKPWTDETFQIYEGNAKAVAVGSIRPEMASFFTQAQIPIEI